VTGWAGVAPFVGERSDGAAGPVGVTVSVAVRVSPLETAEIVATVDVVVAVVVMTKLALLDPAGTVTLAGTVAAGESSESDITVPPLDAGALRVTVPVEALPPGTLVGLTLTATRDGGGARRVTVIADA
jgi:hypothetical protein